MLNYDMQTILGHPVFILFIVLFLLSIIRENLIKRFYANNIVQEDSDEINYKRFFFKRPPDQYLYDRNKKETVKKLFIILNLLMLLLVFSIITLMILETINN